MALATLPGPIDRSLQVSFQHSLFGSAELQCATISSEPDYLDPDSWIIHQPGWLAGSDALFDQLRVELPWRATERPMYDRVVRVPRLICTVDDEDLSDSHPLKIVFRGVSRELSETFFRAGVNYYRTGQDSVAWHRDTIGRSGRPAVVALVSLGSPRTLAVRRHRPNLPKTAETSGTTAATAATGVSRWRLGHGDLFVMGGMCQHLWEHTVPKERQVGPRISLAFRSRTTTGGPRLDAGEVPPLKASHKLG